MENNKGSILLPILLVSTIALSMALAVASRSLKGLKSTGETEQSSTAYSAAEAGIEQALYSVEQGIIPTPVTAPVAVGAGGYIKELTVTESGGGPVYLVEGPVAQDDVAELKLNGYSGSTLSIYWANTVDTSQTSNPASLIITYVYGSSPYAIRKQAVNCTARSNGFAGPFGGTYQEPQTGMRFACKYDFSLAGTSTPQIVRLHLMYNKAEIAVGAQTGTNLPTQSLTITSTGKAGETERTVEVTRSKPSLPAIFDFVLFSGSATQPLTK